MPGYEMTSSKVQLHAAAAATVQILKQLDADTGDDTHINYKKLYYCAFNGLTTILENIGYPNAKSPIFDQIVELQRVLEERYMTAPPK
ncbi:MAG: hypothetical protein K0S60_80 [Evtepia sp.]|jgi:hypothetical protein|nr:hypothetical protein [Evtepia sp.]